MSDETPTGSAASEAEPSRLALDWVQRRVRERLNGLGVTPAVLSAALPGSESSWRSKLNGNRVFHLDDLILIAMAVDGGLFASPPFSSTDLLGFFPPEVRRRLSHTTLGDGLPTLTSRAADWHEAAVRTVTWIANEHAAGRGWLIDATGLARQLLIAVEKELPSTSASLAVATDTGLDIEWVGSDLLLRITCGASLGAAGISSADLRREHTQFANDLAYLTGAPQRDKVLVAVMAPRALAALDEIIGITEAAINDWSMVGLDKLQRLNPAPPSTELLSEAHLYVIARDPDSGMLCLRIK